MGFYMATKKFIIEMEEGRTECGKCPYNMLTEGCRFNKVNQYKQTGFDCNKHNLATMKIKELEENNESKS